MAESGSPTESLLLRELYELDLGLDESDTGTITSSKLKLNYYFKETPLQSGRMTFLKTYISLLLLLSGHQTYIVVP